MYLLKLVYKNDSFFYFIKQNQQHTCSGVPLYIHPTCTIGSFKDAMTFESVEKSLWCDHLMKPRLYLAVYNVLLSSTYFFFSSIIIFSFGSEVKTRKTLPVTN